MNTNAIVETAGDQDAATMVGPSPFKRSLHLAGGLVAVGTLCWYARALYIQRDVFNEIHFGPMATGAVILGVALYPAIYLLGALVWVYAMRSLCIHVPTKSAVSVCFVAQFGKYLPGNFAHHVLKIVLAKAHAASTKQIFLSMIIETGCLCLCGVCIGATALWFYAPLDSSLAQWSPPVTGMFLLTLVFGVAVLASCFAMRMLGQHLMASMTFRPRWLFQCVVLSSIAFAVHGLIAKAILEGVFGVDAVSWTFVTGLFSLAWVTGFVTPGAPAGVGVRETILVVGLDSACEPGIGLAFAGILRLVSVFGDGVTFAIGLLVRRDSNAASEARSKQFQDSH